MGNQSLGSTERPIFLAMPSNSLNGLQASTFFFVVTRKTLAGDNILFSRMHGAGGVNDDLRLFTSFVWDDGTAIASGVILN